jgi:Flp pilus assembly protein TadD
MSAGMPDGLRATLAGVQAALRSGQLEEARRLADAALRSWPDDADARYLAAIVASREKRHAEARVHLVEVVAVRPRFSAA